MRLHVFHTAVIVVVDHQHTRLAKLLQVAVAELETLAQVLVAEGIGLGAALGELAPATLLIARPADQDQRIEQGDPQVDLQGVERGKNRRLNAWAAMGFQHRGHPARQQPNQPAPRQQREQHIDDPHQGVLASSDQFHDHASSSLGLIPRSGLTQRARF